MQIFHMYLTAGGRPALSTEWGH